MPSHPRTLRPTPESAAELPDHRRESGGMLGRWNSIGETRHRRQRLKRSHAWWPTQPKTLRDRPMGQSRNRLFTFGAGVAVDLGT